MSSFLDTLEACYSTRDLYEVLGVDKSAKEGELRRAYLRLSLKVHPDRVTPDQVDEATNKFQVLGKVYAILTDKDKRAIYDEDGTVDEEDDTNFKPDRDWAEYWRMLFSKIKIEDIKLFEESYKGSEEELDTLKSVYMDSEGDMDAILEGVLCSTIEDEPRFRELIQGWIDEGSVPAYRTFVKETKKKKNARKRRYDGEAKEAEEALVQMKSDGGEDALKSLIATRQKSRAEGMGNFFDSLEEKYSSKKPKTSAKGRKTGTASSSSKKMAKEMINFHS